MKHFLTAAAAIALAGTFAIGTAASAQPYGYYHHNDRHAYGHDDYGSHDDYGRRYGGGGYRPVAYNGWRPGGYVPHGDWDRGYRVDYYHYHLRRPPYGYEWRRVDGDFVLGAIATGLIVDSVAGD